MTILELMIKDYQINPAMYKNKAFFRAHENRHLDICTMLLSDERVKTVDLTLIFNRTVEIKWAALSVVI